jgi:hypothetical protein
MNYVLSHKETESLYRSFLEGKISLNGINENHQAQLLIYAKEINQKATDDCLALVAYNPQHDFEYFSSRLNTYRESKQVIDFFNEWHQKKQINEPKPLKSKVQFVKKTTYKWKGSHDDLIDVYRLMVVKHKLIAHETHLVDFIGVFTGKLTDTTRPIKWIDSNKLLAYFLAAVFPSQHWQSIAANNGYFINRNDKPINANDLSVAKNQIENFGKPKGHEKIDLILKTINKP